MPANSKPVPMSSIVVGSGTWSTVFATPEIVANPETPPEVLISFLTPTIETGAKLIESVILQPPEFENVWSAAVVPVQLPPEKAPPMHSVSSTTALPVVVKLPVSDRCSLVIFGSPLSVDTVYCNSISLVCCPPAAREKTNWKPISEFPLLTVFTATSLLVSGMGAGFPDEVPLNRKLVNNLSSMEQPPPALVASRLAYVPLTHTGIVAAFNGDIASSDRQITTSAVDTFDINPILQVKMQTVLLLCVENNRTFGMSQGKNLRDCTN